MKRLLLISLFVLSVDAFAQSSSPAQIVEPTMILTGALYDKYGSVVVAGATVVASGAGGRSYTVTTDEEGVYKFSLPLGVYRLRASAPGFCHSLVERFRVVDSTHGKMALDFVLELPGEREMCRHEITVENKPKRRAKKRSNIIIE